VNVDFNQLGKSETICNSSSHLPSTSATQSSSQNFLESSAFSSKDLCTLIANLEHEISITQQHLDDENDKRHKYKVQNFLT
jgi:hypothetical protein